MSGTAETVRDLHTTSSWINVFRCVLKSERPELTVALLTGWWHCDLDTGNQNAETMGGRFASEHPAEIFLVVLLKHPSKPLS